MIMKGPVTRTHIDRMIDRALHGEYIPYPIDDDLLDKIWELSQDKNSHDPEALREEGYAFLQQDAELDRQFGLT